MFLGEPDVEFFGEGRRDFSFGGDEVLGFRLVVGQAVEFPEV